MADLHPAVVFSVLAGLLFFGAAMFVYMRDALDANKSYWQGVTDCQRQLSAQVPQWGEEVFKNLTLPTAPRPDRPGPS